MEQPYANPGLSLPDWPARECVSVTYIELFFFLAIAVFFFLTVDANAIPLHDYCKDQNRQSCALQSQVFVVTLSPIQEHKLFFFPPAWSATLRYF